MLAIIKKFFSRFSIDKGIHAVFGLGIVFTTDTHMLALDFVVGPFHFAVNYSR